MVPLKPLLPGLTYSRSNLNERLWIRPDASSMCIVTGETKLHVPASGTRMTTNKGVGSGNGAVMPPYSRLRE